MRAGPWRRLNTEKLMLSNCGAEEDALEFLGQQGDQTSQSWKKETLNIHWKDWYWGWSSKTLATDVKGKLIGKDWCWEILRAGGEEGNRGWDGWMVSLTLDMSEKTLWDGDGQGSLACCSPWVAKNQTGLSDWTKTKQWKQWKDPWKHDCIN